MSEKRGGWVYVISCKCDARIYVGSTFSGLAKRWKEHQWALRSKRHPSPNLQKLYDDHGIDVFKFKVVETVEVGKSVRAKEQRWINNNRGNLLNASFSAWAPDRTGAKMPKDWIDAHSLKMKGNSYRKGILHSAADKNKISDGLRKAHKEGRRKPVDLTIATKNLSQWNRDAKAGIVKSGRKPKTERNAQLVAFYLECKNIATTARHFGIRAPGARAILLRDNPHQKVRKRRFLPKIIPQTIVSDMEQN